MQFLLSATEFYYVSDDQVRSYCLLGGAAGSLAYILRQKLFEKEGVVTVFLTNLLLSCIFSPLICHRLPVYGIQITFDVCLAISGAAAMTAPWLFSTVFPVLGKKTVASVKTMNLKELSKKLFNLKDRSDG